MGIVKVYKGGVLHLCVDIEYMCEQKKNMPMRNNLTIRNILPVSWPLKRLSYGFVILSAAPEGRWNIRRFRRDRASQAPLDGGLD